VPVDGHCSGYYSPVDDNLKGPEGPAWCLLLIFITILVLCLGLLHGEYVPPRQACIVFGYPHWWCFTGSRGARSSNVPLFLVALSTPMFSIMCSTARRYPLAEGLSPTLARISLLFHTFSNHPCRAARVGKPVARRAGSFQAFFACKYYMCLLCASRIQHRCSYHQGLCKAGY
jgi:hypothetical protein